MRQAAHAGYQSISYRSPHRTRSIGSLVALRQGVSLRLLRRDHVPARCIPDQSEAAVLLLSWDGSATIPQCRVADVARQSPVL